MQEINAITFHTPRFERLDFYKTMDAAVNFVKQDPRSRYKIIIGSDTSAYRTEPLTTSIITAVIVWRVGKGAVYFWTKSMPRVFHTRRDRIIGETMASLMLAQEIRSCLKDMIGDEFLWDGNEIHADVGSTGETRVYIREVTGLIRGFNFEPVIKPQAWCASVVADRHAG